MIAELTTSNSLIYNKLKEAYNGRKNILGCEKVHVTGSFDCLLQVATKKSFDCLYEEFLFIVEKDKLINSKKMCLYYISIPSISELKTRIRRLFMLEVLTKKISYKSKSS